MKTIEFPMANATIAFRANFIRLNAIGLELTASELEKFLNSDKRILLRPINPYIEVEQSTLLSPAEPQKNKWIITEDADINDDWGEGIQIQTHYMHGATEAMSAMENLLGFIRAEGVTDKSCRLYIDINMPGLPSVNPLEILFHVDEPKNIVRWSRFGRYTAKSHLENLAADLHTNLYWHTSAEHWMKNANSSLSYDRGYTIDLGKWMSAGIMEFSFVQGPHYEHRQSDVAETIEDCLFACRSAVLKGEYSFVAFQKAQSFWKEHTTKANPNARYREP